MEREGGSREVGRANFSKLCLQPPQFIGCPGFNRTICFFFKSRSTISLLPNISYRIGWMTSEKNAVDEDPYTGNDCIKLSQANNYVVDFREDFLERVCFFGIESETKKLLYYRKLKLT